jgi:DNA-binding FadR family transcriptional regulator
METDTSLVELTADRLIQYIIDNRLKAGEQLFHAY